MSTLASLNGRSGPSTVVLTDSGLGGLLFCAELERRLRTSAGEAAVRLVYVNAWPEEGRGYNDLPDIAARAAVFDRALAAMAAFRPGLILIACNTLSVVYESTAFIREPSVPVAGILDEGADLFAEALDRDPSGILALFGTRTTIGSGEYPRRLARRGVDPDRIFAEPCHGLAAAIDKDPGAAVVPGLVDECVGRLAPRLPAGAPVYAGLACTHFAYVSAAFGNSLGRRAGAKAEVLDPGRRFVDALTAGLAPRRPGGRKRTVTVEVVSKVGLGEAQRQAIGRRLEPVSAPTARALAVYTRVPNMF